jgi:hypothetical protein
VLLFGAMAEGCIAQSPSLSYSIPSALAPGKTSTVAFFGDNLADASALWTSFATEAIERTAAQDPGSSANKIGFRISVGAQIPIGIGAVRIATTNGITGLLLLMIDDLPSVEATGRNKTLQTAQELKLPVAVDGRSAEQSSDYYEFLARKGERITIEAVAQRLGSSLDPVIRLVDARGQELEYCEDTPGLGADICFSRQFATAGKYFIEIRDTRYQGGNKHRYRLRVGDFPSRSLPFLPFKEVLSGSITRSRGEAVEEIEPNDAFTNATQVSIPAVIHGRFDKPRDRDFYKFRVTKDQRLVFAGKTRSFGSPCDLFMELYKQDGSHLMEANVSGPDEGTITNTFGQPGAYYLLVEELNRRGGPDLAYRVEASSYLPGFDLAAETNKVEAAPSGSFDLKVTCARREYDGPIELRLTGAASGFSMTNYILAAKTNETRLTVTLPADVRVGEILHFGVVGMAKVGNDKFETFASTMPALGKFFSSMLYPPRELDGWIALGVKVGKREQPQTPNQPAGEK